MGKSFLKRMYLGRAQIQGFPVEWLNLAQSPLVAKDARPVVEAGQGIGMSIAQGGAPQLQGLSHEIGLPCGCLLGRDASPPWPATTAARLRRTPPHHSGQ